MLTNNKRLHPITSRNGKCWNESKQWKMNIQPKLMLNVEMGKGICPHLILPYLQHLYRRDRTNRRQDRIIVFHDHHLSHWSWSPAMDFTSYGCFLRPHRVGGRKWGPNLNMYVDMLNAVIRPARSGQPRRICSFDNAFVLFDANLWIRSFEQAGIPYSRCWRTNAPYNGNENQCFLQSRAFHGI